MSFTLPHRFILVTALGGLLAACGQKGPLYVPTTPAAAQRATLPQTVFGGASAAAAPASAPDASAPVPALPPSPLLPALPDISNGL